MIVRTGRQTDIEMMRIALVFAALLAALPTHPAAEVHTLGFYSNQVSSRSEDPHLEGYSVTLYREGKILFGRFCWATGIEVPCAPIQEASLDPHDRLKFKVKMSIGTEISKATAPEGRPARDLVEFRGKWSSARIKGNLSKLNGYDLSLPETIEKVVLQLSDVTPDSVKSHEDWLADPRNAPADW